MDDSPVRLDEDEAVAALGTLDPAALADVADRTVTRLRQAGDPPPLELRRQAWTVLDVLRRPPVLRRLAEADTPGWASRLVGLVEASDLTVGPLFRMRADAYGSKPLFEIPGRGGFRTVSWRQAASRVDALARGLLTLADGPDPGRLAILSDNRPETALLDLACLSSGIEDVPIPATATEADVLYVLSHCRAETVVVSGEERLRRLLERRESLPGVRRFVSVDPHPALGRDVLSLDEVAARGTEARAVDPAERGRAVRIGDPATVMYTSGTTGFPKGIRFSHRNLVTKRFLRALALPQIGETDVFLCYLPLYHTFGRFLELLGCVFWGSTYCFLDSPSVEAMVQGMRRHRPTAFISVPRKWMQLHEAIAAQVDVETAPDEAVLAATRQVTGGRLRWGISAAGYLGPDLFRFFQRQGIELVSGFGMTEATGGITMTPPGRYKDDSLGPPLPGIEVMLDEDGEMLVRGPYVMMGYLDPPDGAPSFTPDGWFRTGDLMEIDPDGYYRLVDRKKEIYKNVKGETIAPQRVESLFRDFEEVGRVFLVGDHREYNTALIWPNPAFAGIDLAALSDSERKAHFRSLVVTVNNFLSPYERIVDFALIGRDLDPARGELTAKGTPRRRAVEENFADVIRLLYRRASVPVGGVDVLFPNWLFQALGLTAQDLQVGHDQIVLPSRGRALPVRSAGPGVTLVGSALYRHPPGPVNLGAILTTPRLWLGNEGLVEFTALDPAARVRPGRAGEEIAWAGRPEPAAWDPAREEQLRSALRRSEMDLADLHAAALALGSASEEAAFSAVRLLEKAVTEDREGALAEPARLLLARAAGASAPVRRRAFQVLALAEREARFPATLESFLAGPEPVLDPETRGVIGERDLSDARLEAFVDAARAACSGEAASPETDVRAAGLLRFLAEYGAQHPTRYRRLRAFLARVGQDARRPEVAREAAAAARALEDGFRAWLGPTPRIAVDPETGREYRWEDVVVFDDGIEEEDRRRVLSALKGTAFLREAAFLFSGAAVRLQDIPPGGVWVRLLGTRHAKAVYRVTVQTRWHGAFDAAVNVNRFLTRDQVREEIRWLILCGEGGTRGSLVEDFGGYWEEQDLWSEEFIPGETLDRAMRRLARRGDPADRLGPIWPFFALSALSAYIDFWNRTGRSLEVSDPGAANVIVPTHDYHTGARIVSITARRPYRGLAPMLASLMSDFVEPIERQYPQLRGQVDWETVCSALLEVVGEEEGAALLRALEPEDLPPAALPALARFLDKIAARGYLPMRLFFAARRYLRWRELTGDPTPAARARHLHDLWETYGLGALVAAHPEVRVRFFRETVLTDIPEPLAEGLESIIARLRTGELHPEQTGDAVADLRAGVTVGEEADYFLARLTLPHLKPEDQAGFVMADLGGRHQSEVVVALEDEEGTPYQVRHALNPKEVGRLHRLFLAAKLDVRFRPEHRYLVAVHERGAIIGGIYYEIAPEDRSAHLEKIVVSEPFRKKGVADGLMREFLNRLQSEGVRTVTTGFFRPEYFYAYGFRIEKRYAGLVKSLEPAEG